MNGTLRARMAGALAAVLAGEETLDQALGKLRERAGDDPAAAFAQEALYGTLRRYFGLSARLDACLERPLKPRDLPVRALLLLSINECLHMGTPAHAAVHEAVAACALLDRPWAKGLVNAILRGLLRRPEGPAVRETPETRHEHPSWLIDRLFTDWPAEAGAILAADTARPPLTLRVNATLISREDFLAELARRGVRARPTRWSAQGVRIDDVRPVRALPGYAEGWFAVQDEAAQLAVPLLAPTAGDRILDACAAPGGKTTHLLEYAPGASVVAVEVNQRRVRELRENLTRLQLACEVRTEDVRAYAAAASARGETFSQILLDAPCSALGVVRRHPDIRLRRSPEDVAVAAERQLALLCALWPLLAPAGVLLYVTCSILHAENDGVVSAFLARQADARPEQVPVGWGIPTTHGQQILTGMDDMDGFYFARLRQGDPA